MAGFELEGFIYLCAGSVLIFCLIFYKLVCILFFMYCVHFSLCL